MTIDYVKIALCVPLFVSSLLFAVFYLSGRTSAARRSFMVVCAAASIAIAFAYDTNGAPAWFDMFRIIGALLMAGLIIPLWLEEQKERVTAFDQLVVLLALRQLNDEGITPASTEQVSQRVHDILSNLPPDMAEKLARARSNLKPSP